MSPINRGKYIDLKSTAPSGRLAAGAEGIDRRGRESSAEYENIPESKGHEISELLEFWSDSLSRRKFLALMGASLALAGASGCSVKPAPSVDLVPYVHPPKDVVPGRPLFYATTMTFAGTATGLLVESNAGRPTKIEGNPNHPASLRRHRHLSPGFGACIV